MSRLSVLHRHPLHLQAENADFILRMRYKAKNSFPQRSDSINLFIQLHFLYEAMESRLNELKASVIVSANELKPSHPNPLSQGGEGISSAETMTVAELKTPGSDERYDLLSFFDQSPWLNRSSKLAEDIQTMNSFMASEKHTLTREVRPAFREAIEKIKTYGAVELLACFAVRCLGDVFGGQALHRYNQSIFSGKPLTNAFYGGVSKEVSSISQYVNDIVLTDTEEVRFSTAVDDIFKAHVDLFQEMEGARNPIVYSPVSDCNRYVLFGFTVASAALSVAMAYASEQP